MIQNKDYQKNITIIDIIKNFPCTLISLISSFTIHSLIINPLNQRELLPNIIDGLLLYIFLLSSVEEMLSYALKDVPNFTDTFRLKLKRLALIVITVIALLYTVLNIFLIR